MSYNPEKVCCELCEQVKDYTHFIEIVLPDSSGYVADICDDCQLAIRNGKPKEDG